MSSRMNSAAAHAHANSVSPALDAIRGAQSIARVPSNSVEITQEIVEKPNGRELVRYVNDVLKLKQDSFAQTAGCASSDCSNALNKNQRFDIQWVMNQTPEYQALFITAWEDRLHVTPQQRRRTAMRCYLNRVFDFLKEESA